MPLSCAPTLDYLTDHAGLAVHLLDLPLALQSRGCVHRSHHACGHPNLRRRPCYPPSMKNWPGKRQGRRHRRLSSRNSPEASPAALACPSSQQQGVMRHHGRSPLYHSTRGLSSRFLSRRRHQRVQDRCRVRCRARRYAARRNRRRGLLRGMTCQECCRQYLSPMALTRARPGRGMARLMRTVCNGSLSLLGKTCVVLLQ